jgi:hypothetical protein
MAVPSAVPDLADGHVDVDGDAGGGGLRQVVVVRLRTQFNIRFPIVQYIFRFLYTYIREELLYVQMVLIVELDDVLKVTSIMVQYREKKFEERHYCKRFFFI